jgi:hypothetical protein
MYALHSYILLPVCGICCDGWLSLLWRHCRYPEKLRELRFGPHADGLTTRSLLLLQA